MNELTLPLRNLIGQPLRALLTVLGIAVAVGSFVAMTGLTHGVQASFESGLGEPGGDLVVSQRDTFSLLSSSVPQGIAPELMVEGVEAVSPVLLDVTTADDQANIVISGWPEDSFLWKHLTLSAGRTPAPGQQEVVLGETIAKGLGKGIGDTVELEFEPYTIVGIATFSTVLNQNIALVGIDHLQELLGREATVTLFQVRLTRPLNPGGVDAVRQRIAAAAPNFSVSDTEEFASNIRFFQIIQAIASSISIVVMATAVLVVANTLLMAVNERTYELGILAAIGWRPARILRLILIEGLVMSVIGGLLGIGIGLLAMEVVSRTEIAAGVLEPYTSPWLIGQAVIAVLIAGPLGALYPAWRATRLVPAEALRRI
jgi:putative ABC transport system permease protein